MSGQAFCAYCFEEDETFTMRLMALELSPEHGYYMFFCNNNCRDCMYGLCLRHLCDQTFQGFTNKGELIYLDENGSRKIRTEFCDTTLVDPPELRRQLVMELQSDTDTDSVCSTDSGNVFYCLEDFE